MTRLGTRGEEPCGTQMTMIRSRKVTKVARKLVAHLAAHGVDASAEMVDDIAQARALAQATRRRPRGMRGER